MTAIRLKAHIPENRLVTLAFPADAPLGDVELEVAIRQRGELLEPAIEITLPPENRSRVHSRRPTHPTLAKEFDAFERMLPELLLKYPGKYVVIHDAAVAAVADTEVEALTIAHADFPGLPLFARRVIRGSELIERLPHFRPVNER